MFFQTLLYQKQHSSEGDTIKDILVSQSVNTPPHHFHQQSGLHWSPNLHYNSLLQDSAHSPGFQDARSLSEQPPD